jgi:hypothetical protein
MDRHFDDQRFNDPGLKTQPEELFQRNCWTSFEPVERSPTVLANCIGAHKIMGRPIIRIPMVFPGGAADDRQTPGII